MAHRTHPPTLPEYDERAMAHLLQRAGFGATRTQVAAATQTGLRQTVQALMDYEQVPESIAPPPPQILTYGQHGSVYPDFQALTVWWLNAMLATQRPLQEKMVLFWHGHFATGFDKVRSTLLMYQQNQTFRAHALGRFDDLLLAMAQDPAMLIWLDGYRNTAAAPNENWGREVMELFCLGHGNYTEDDVHACSRAFTGWRLRPDGSAYFTARLHDQSVKAFLGQTGAWGTEDAVRILAAHPATGPFLAAKLWRFFASDRPPEAAIKQLAAVYNGSDHSIREMVRTLFLLPEFYRSTVRTGHIKSPVEFVLTPLRQLGLTDVDLTHFPAYLMALGQQLFNPPNVGGWPGGPTWINAATMLARFNFASLLTGDAGAGTIDPDALLEASGAFATEQFRVRAASIMETIVASILETLNLVVSDATSMALLQYAGTGPLSDPYVTAKIRGLVHLALVSPEYQAS